MKPIFKEKISEGRNRNETQSQEEEAPMISMVPFNADQILCPVDRSELSSRALNYAVPGIGLSERTQYWDGLRNSC